MALRNADVAELIERLGDLYELDGAVVYRVLAYRRAARRIAEATEPVERLSVEGRLTDLPDVGATIAAKVEELRTTGTLASLERLQAKYPPGLVDVMRLPGVGAKTARRLFDLAGIASVDDLREAAESGRIRELPRLSERTEQKLLAAIAAGAEPRKREVLLDRAVERAAGLLAHLRAHPACVAADEAGSLRRRRETVGDLDLIAASDEPAALLAAFAELGRADDADVTAQGDSKATIVGHDGIQVDLRVVPPAAYGNLLQHFTGSKEHNVALREVAAARGLRVSEWGVEEVESGEVFRSEDEAAVYERLGYAWIPPELRENRGELEAARDGRLPRLVEVADLRGDLHAHSTASDGKATVAQMAAAARERGYGYLAITDHSAGVGMGIGLDAGQIREHAANIREHAAGLADEGFALLAGVEVDILADATLDLPDDVLAGLDWVVASVHGARGQTREQITARLVAAARHPHVDVIGHPTGRMLGRRDAYDVDLEAVIAACAEHGTFLEINSNPNRLDLKPTHARMALDAGVRLLINTDAHRTTTLRLIEYGVAQARRAWATADDILNTRTWAELSGLRKPGRPPGPRLGG